MRTIFFEVKNVEKLGGFQKYTIALLEFSRGRSGIIKSEITEWLLFQSQTPDLACVVQVEMKKEHREGN